MFGIFYSFSGRNAYSVVSGVVFMYSSVYIWSRILRYLEKQLTEPVVAAWFDDAEVVELTDNRLVLCSPSPFRREIIQNRAAEHVKSAMKELFDSNVELLVLGQDELEPFHEKKHKLAFLDFNPQFTFEKFVVGDSNRMAHAVAMAVANDPGTSKQKNPFFIHGPSGLGKTHLLYAIATQVHKNNPDANIIYVSGEQFANELIFSIRDRKNAEFRQKYRSADLFLIDDIHFIAGKDSLQEEFFNTFNALYEENKQIVMAADRPPSEMAHLEERLRTRFEWGTLTEITPPDYLTRMVILQNNALEMGLELPQEVCTFIAENVTSDVRKLEGALNILHAVQELEKIPITMETASRALKNIKPDVKAKPSADLICTAVCRFYSIEDTVLRSTQKSKTVAEARQVAMYLMNTIGELTTPEIGRVLNRDHSTVIYGCRRIAGLLEDRNTGMQDNLRDIIADIKNHQ